MADTPARPSHPVGHSSADRPGSLDRFVFDSYVAVRDEIADGDLFLWRSGSVLHSHMIAAAGRGKYSHAEKAVWLRSSNRGRPELDVLLSAGMLVGGGRLVPLSDLVRRYPGRIDWFSVNPRNRWPQYDQVAATAFMARLVGQSYGFLGLALTALRHIPVVRQFLPVPDDGDCPKRPPFCSHACAMADRIGGGVDPVPHLADRLTEPNDLARSHLYLYQATLVYP